MKNLNITLTDGQLESLQTFVDQNETQPNGYKQPAFWMLFCYYPQPSTFEEADRIDIHLPDGSTISYDVQDGLAQFNKEFTQSDFDSTIFDEIINTLTMVQNGEEPNDDDYPNVILSYEKDHLAPYANNTHNFLTKKEAEDYVKNELAHKNLEFVIGDATLCHSTSANTIYDIMNQILQKIK